MASGARTANRVVAISKGEAENSEDIEFKNKLDAASNSVTSGMYVVLSLSPPPPPHTHLDTHTHTLRHAHSLVIH